MPDDKPSERPILHIDNDWKKQAQEEKRRLAEKEAQRATEPPAAAPMTGGDSAVSPFARGGGVPAGRETAPARGAQAGKRPLPPVGLASLVQPLITQVMFYLGELGQSEGINLDMAKYQLDTLNVLEEKTANNLSPEEQRLLDTAMYEARTRFINVAAQFI